MKTKLAFTFVSGLAVLTVLTIISIFLFFLVDTFFVSEQAPDYVSDYVSQSERKYITYEISHVPKGYENSVYDITVSGLSDEEKQALFDEWRQQEDWAEEYEEARAIAENDNTNTNNFVEAEEVRIEEYCDEEGFLSCYNIKYTCGTEWECHLVTIECRDDNYDPYKEMQFGKKYSCDEWEVTVEEDSFDIRDVDESYWDGYGYQW